MAFPVSWAGKHKITIDNTKVTGSSNYTNVPVYLSTSEFLTAAFDNSDNGGGDIRFSSDEAGTIQLSVEIVSWVTGTDNAEVWVKIPTLSHDADTDIYVWYDKTGESQPAAGAAFGSQSVWSNGFTKVYHMDDATTSTIGDSTASASTLTKGGANTPIETSAGKIGNAQQYAVNEFSSTTDVKMEDGYMGFWFRPDVLINAGSGNIQMFSVNVGGANDGDTDIFFAGPDFGSAGNDGGEIMLQQQKAPSTTARIFSNAASWAANTWFHLGLRWGASGQRMYVNGVEQTDTDALDAWYGGNSATFRIIGEGQPWDGRIDEVIYSGTDLGADWMTTTYNNQNAPGTFATASAIVSAFTPRVMFI